MNTTLYNWYYEIVPCPLNCTLNTTLPYILTALALVLYKSCLISCVFYEHTSTPMQTSIALLSAPCGSLRDLSCILTQNHPVNRPWHDRTGPEPARCCKSSFGPIPTRFWHSMICLQGIVTTDVSSKVENYSSLSFVLTSLFIIFLTHGHKSFHD